MVRMSAPGSAYSCVIRARAPALPGCTSMRFSTQFVDGRQFRQIVVAAAAQAAHALVDAGQGRQHQHERVAAHAAQARDDVPGRRSRRATAGGRAPASSLRRRPGACRRCHCRRLSRRAPPRAGQHKYSEVSASSSMTGSARWFTKSGGKYAQHTPTCATCQFHCAAGKSTLRAVPGARTCQAGKIAHPLQQQLRASACGRRWRSQYNTASAMMIGRAAHPQRFQHAAWPASTPLPLHATNEQQAPGAPQTSTAMKSTNSLALALAMAITCGGAAAKIPSKTCCSMKSPSAAGAPPPNWAPRIPSAPPSPARSTRARNSMTGGNQYAATSRKTRRQTTATRRSANARPKKKKKTPPPRPPTS